MLSGNICRDISCLVIKIPELNQLGMIMKAPLSEKEEQEISVAFIDDTDFFIAGENVIEKIKEILREYQELF